MISDTIRWWSGPCAFRVYGKTRRETEWRTIDVYATERRDRTSAWPLWRGTCICWSAEVIAVGWDFAQELLSDPTTWLIDRQNPVSVAAGSFRNLEARIQAGAPSIPYAAEVLAHEIGHTFQALRYGVLYLPMVGAVTWLGEGPHSWNRFENDASAQGQFGGIVPGSVQRLP